MKNYVISLLCICANILLADVKIDYALRMRSHNQERIIHKSVIFKSVDTSDDQLTNPTTTLRDSESIVQQIHNVLIGIDLLHEQPNGIDVVFTVAQKQVDGVLLPIAQIPISTEFDKEQELHTVLDNVGGVESITLSLLATSIDEIN